MSDKTTLPKKKTTTGPGELEMESMPSTAPKKRKAGKTARREPSAHEVAHVASIHAEPRSREMQGRRSDSMPLHATTLELPRQRHPQVSLTQRRTTSMVDTHRPRRSNMSNAGSRPHKTRRASVPPGPPRTMLQHAWHTIRHSDPLMDSDEECPDEHLRLDYSRRMQVITRLRGRPPTPEFTSLRTMPS